MRHGDSKLCCEPRHRKRDSRGTSLRNAETDERHFIPHETSKRSSSVLDPVLSTFEQMSGLMVANRNKKLCSYSNILAASERRGKIEATDWAQTRHRPILPEMHS